MLSPTAICNQALDEISARATVTSIDPSDGTQAGDICARHYQPRIDALFRSAHWNFARMQAPMTLLRARAGTPPNPSGALPNPPFPWLYEYAVPTVPKCLKARYIVPQLPGQTATTVPLTTGPQTVLPAFSGANTPPFILSSDVDANGKQISVILTNQLAALLVYTARIEDPELWDPRFVEAAVMLLAAWIASPVNGSMQQAAKCTTMAQTLVMQARISDGDEGTSQVDLTPDWIFARSRTSGLTIPGVSCGAGWDSLALPGGTVF